METQTEPTIEPTGDAYANLERKRINTQSENGKRRMNRKQEDDGALCYELCVI